MKKLILVSFFLTISNTYAFSFLTPIQEEFVLEELNVTTLDTWNISDFNFLFKKIECSIILSSCQITYDTIFTDFSEETGEDEEVSRRTMSCIVPDLNEYTDLMRKDSAWTNLNQNFYENIGEYCLGPNMDAAFDLIPPEYM